MRLVMPCTCQLHRAGAEVKIDHHTYRFEEKAGADGWPCWRWACGCGRKGQYQYQSDAVSYHQWLRHAGRTPDYPPPAGRAA